MFFLMGIGDGVRDCGVASGGRCPVCGKSGLLRVTNQYMRLHVFFIPIVTFGNSYLVTCGSCASLMELDKEKGRSVRRNRPVEILPGDLRVLQNNAAPVCRRCGQRAQRGSAFCSRCGERL